MDVNDFIRHIAEEDDQSSNRERSSEIFCSEVPPNRDEQEPVQKGRVSVIRLQVASQNASNAVPEFSGAQSREIADAVKGVPDSSPVKNSTNVTSSDEVPSCSSMQRFLTSDGQYLYGYKDSKGEFHFFYPTLSDRENHNEKERQRRSRVSEACSCLRKLVPGLTKKTDKASVFEQAARYLAFLRKKHGTQYDQIYCEKRFLGRS